MYTGTRLNGKDTCEILKRARVFKRLAIRAAQALLPVGFCPPLFIKRSPPAYSIYSKSVSLLSRSRYIHTDFCIYLSITNRYEENRYSLEEFVLEFDSSSSLRKTGEGKTLATAIEVEVILILRLSFEVIFLSILSQIYGQYFFIFFLFY